MKQQADDFSRRFIERWPIVVHGQERCLHLKAATSIQQNGNYCEVFNLNEKML